MQSLTRSRCFQRQIHAAAATDDMELENEATDLGNKRESVEELVAVTVEPALLNGTHDSSTMSMETDRIAFLEVFLSFYYYIGVSPFRVDRNRNLRSCWINKVLSISITLMTLIYIIINVRRLAWRIDKPYISQQVKASSYIGLVNQLCLLLLNICVFQMVWCKQEGFRKLIHFQDISEVSATLKSSPSTFLVTSICSLTILMSLISIIGGLTIMDWHQTWSFYEILSHHENEFFMGLKKSWDYTDSNETSSTGSNTTGNDEYSGIFLSDGDLETIIFGSVGMAVDFFQHVFSLFSHDCFLLSTISLWMSTKGLRDQLKVWRGRATGDDMDCEEGNRNFADEIVKEYRELSLLSTKINAITNSFLPALVMGNIITMSYFMYNLVTRQWYFALYLSLKLCKIWVAIYFAMKTSKVAERYCNWFMSKDVQEVLDLSCKQLQRIFVEMKESPMGNGSSVFYIDTRFLLSSLGIISTYFYMVTGTGT